MCTVAKTIALVAILLAPASADAGGTRRTGTAGALELLIPTDARGAAMGGSVVAATEGANAWFWNPAGAAAVEGTEVAFAHRAYIADISLDQLSLAYHAGSMGVIGLSAKVLSTGNELVYTTTQPEGTGETFSSSFVVVGVSYARTLTDQVSFGINGNYVSEQIFRESAHGVAFDLGFMYRPSFRGVTLGVSIKNYGPKMKFDGPDFGHNVDVGNSADNSGHTGRTQSASFELPSFIQLGMAWDAFSRPRQRLRLTGVFQSNSFTEDEFRVGSEWSVSNQLFLRGGYATSTQEKYIYGFSAGVGLRIPLGGAETVLDYTWVGAGVFDSNHFFSVKLSF